MTKVNTIGETAKREIVLVKPTTKIDAVAKLFDQHDIGGRTTFAYRRLRGAHSLSLHYVLPLF